MLSFRFLSTLDCSSAAESSSLRNQITNMSSPSSEAGEPAKFAEFTKEERINQLNEIDKVQPIPSSVRLLHPLTSIAHCTAPSIRGPRTEIPLSLTKLRWCIHPWPQGSLPSSHRCLLAYPEHGRCPPEETNLRLAGGKYHSGREGQEGGGSRGGYS